MLYSTIHVTMYFIKKLPVMRMLSREREERRGGREENFLFSLPIFVVKGEKKTSKYRNRHSHYMNRAYDLANYSKSRAKIRI